MDYAWAEVLDYSCDWAEGETTATGAAEEITKGIYNDLGLMYDRVQSGPPPYCSQEGGSFNLTDFLGDVQEEEDEIEVYCFDVAKALVIFGNAVGCDMTYRMSSMYTYYCFGYLNCVMPIGLSYWTNNPFHGIGSWLEDEIVSEDLEYLRSYFLKHAFAAIGDAENPQYVYDACIKVDSDANPDYSPCVESWLIGESWNVYSGTYNQKVIDDNPTHSNPTGPAKPFVFTVY